ncbi:MAG TPA: MiaB/RimO family radical SAM methylthiotransferase [Acetobacteraceae bacterium]|nr:MiaB/RimO family radical SAM methylthiotransferase [Acetobacteraceae bacterium]
MSAEIVTFGCRLNAAESEVIHAHAAHLSDTVVVNTCAVTAEAERQARQAIRRLARERPGARIVVTGCAAHIAPAAWARLPGVSLVLDNSQKLDPGAWGATAPAAPVVVPDFAGRARAFVEVQHGCDHACTFCIIPAGRGPSRSIASAGVVAQVRALVERGFPEIVLTGVDLTSYRADLPHLGALARRILADVPDLARLRPSSLDPEEIDADLWRLLAEETRLMPHLHLSIQAGSDLILKRMKRRHSRAGALAAVARARALRPGIAVGADLIAGFPTETEALFAETLDFVAEAALPYLHVFPYSERPGTPAARMPPVPVAARRERAARLRQAARLEAASFHAALVGRDVAVLVERDGAGRSEHFCPVRGAAGAAGSVVRARVAAADADGLLVA